MNYMLREFSTRENQISELKVSREDDGLRWSLSHSCCRVADFSVMLNFLFLVVSEFQQPCTLILMRSRSICP